MHFFIPLQVRPVNRFNPAMQKKLWSKFYTMHNIWTSVTWHNDMPTIWNVLFVYMLICSKAQFSVEGVLWGWNGVKMKAQKTFCSRLCLTIPSLSVRYPSSASRLLLWRRRDVHSKLLSKTTNTQPVMQTNSSTYVTDWAQTRGTENSLW